MLEFFEGAIKGEVTQENARELFPSIKPETANKITELLDNEDFLFLVKMNEQAQPAS